MKFPSLVLGLICMGLLSVTVYSQSSKGKTLRKKTVTKPAAEAPPSPPKVEAPKPAPPPEPRAQNFSSETEKPMDTSERRLTALKKRSNGKSESPFNSYGLLGGTYSADMLGSSNPYGYGFVDWSPEPLKYYLELGIGVGRLQSPFSKSIYNASIFENNLLINLDGLIGLPIWGYIPKGAIGVESLPFLLIGVSALYQGTVPNLGGVIGFGNRIPLPYFEKSQKLKLHYSIRDQLYAQRISSVKPALSHNISLLIGIQFY